MRSQCYFSMLLLTTVVVQPSLAESSSVDKLVGEWLSAPAASTGSPDKPLAPETTLTVKKDHQFVLRRRTTMALGTIIYKGLIKERDNKIIAEVILGPVICGGTAPNRDWRLAIGKDTLTVYYSEKNGEPFVRKAKQQTVPGEQAVAPNGP